jgi:DNA-binding protein HU-beta
MNKTELTKAVAEETGMKQSEVAPVVDRVFEIIARSVKNNEKVSIAGFGTFEARTRAARDGRNPASGEAIKIAARTSAAFKPAAALKAM